jgi:DUF4097 and DUF4098 domain-containing protein YvlB
MKALQLLAACMLFVSAIYAQDPEYSFKETYDVSLPAQLAISTSDGNINVIPSAGHTIEVFYIVRKNNEVLKINKGALEEEVMLDIIHNGNSLKITTRYKDEHMPAFGRNRMNVSFELHVPAQIVCDLNTSDGNVSVKGLNGDQQLKTSDGNIRIENVAGSINGRTSDGDINVREINGAVEVRTSDGNIELTNIKGDVLSSTSDGNIRIANVDGNTSSKTSDGHITFDALKGSFTGVTSDGNITGNILVLRKELTARTGDGNIDITVPDKIGLDLDIKGESLHVPLNSFSGRSDEDVIKGKANGGGIPVSLSTSDGNVTLAYK